MKNFFLLLGFILFISCQNEFDDLPCNCNFEIPEYRDTTHVLTKNQVDFYKNYWKKKIMTENDLSPELFESHFKNITTYSSSSEEQVLFRIMYVVEKDWVKFVYSNQFIVRFSSTSVIYPQYGFPKGEFLSERWLDISRPIIDGKNTNRFNLKSTLKFKTCETACLALRKKTKYKTLGLSNLSFYVAHRLPHTEGDIYLFGHGIIDERKNKCVGGYINLFDEKVDSSEGVCSMSGAGR